MSRFLCILVIVACSGKVGNVATEDMGREALVRAIGGDPVSLDPQRAGDTFSFEVLRDLFEGLTVESPSGEVIPGAAESWTVSEDGLTYDFFLRRDGRWSNGELVTAAHFVRAMQHAVDPSTVSPQADFLKSIAGAKEVLDGIKPRSFLAVHEVGPYHLVIKLLSPTPYFLMLLSNSVAYPRYELPASMHNDRLPGVVSNGPYILRQWVPGSKIILSKSPTYRESRAISFEKVTYLPIADSAMQSRGFKSGAIDVTDSVPDAEFVGSGHGVRSDIQVAQQLSVVYYVFNMRKSPLKDSAELRTALILAVDRSKIALQVLGGGEQPAFSFVPMGMGAYPTIDPASDANPRRHEAEVEVAKAMYRRAGYSRDKPLSLVLMCPTDSRRRLVSVAVSAMWHEVLGVNVQLVYLDYRSYLAARADGGRWDVISEGWNADFQDPVNFLDVFSSSSHQNDSGYSDAGFDDLIARSARARSTLERYVILASAEKELLRAQVVLPLYFPVTRRFISPRIDNSIISPMNHNYSKYFRVRKEKGQPLS